MVTMVQLDRPGSMGVCKSIFITAAVVAAIAFFILRKNRAGNDPIDMIACKLGDLKLAAEEIEAELTKNVDMQIQNIGEALNQKLDDWTVKLKNVLMSAEMQDALGTIQFVLDNVKKFDMEAKEYDSFAFMLMSLVKKAQDSSEVAAWENNLPKNSEIETSQLERARRVGEFAVNVYPASWRTSLESIARQMGISEDDIEFVWFNDDDDGHCPKFILFLDHETQSLILAVRGTFSLKDVILDIVCDEVPFLDGFAHKGILHGANRILSKIHDKLTKSLLLHPGYSLIVTGHSLGAGTAQLITLELHHGKQKSILPAQTSVSCIALAPPPVYRPKDSIFSKSLPASTKEAIEIYINNYDCVPRLSLGSIARLLASMRAVDSLSLTLSQQFAILADREEQEVKENLERVIRSVAESRQDEFPFLQHPGKIFYLKKRSVEGKEQMVYKQESHTFSGALLLLENMLADHLQPSYQEALRNAQPRN